MSNRTHDINQLLRAANPVASPSGPEPLDERASHDLHTILRSPISGSREVATRTVSRPSRFSRTMLVGGLAAVASVAIIAGGVATGGGWLPSAGNDMAFAATPPPLEYTGTVGSTDVGAILEDIAARVEQLPDDTGQGQYAYVEQQSWSLSTRINNMLVTSEVVPQRIRAWRGVDGSGRIETTTMGGDSAGEETDTYGPGEMLPMWPLGSLSPDYETLSNQLAVGHPASNGPAERLIAIEDAYREMPLPPEVRADMLRYLADTPGLEFRGDVTDRAGREGLGFAVESDETGLPTQYTVIIDFDNGRVLGAEEMLTTSAGKLNVEVPAIVAYTAYLDARYEDE